MGRFRRPGAEVLYPDQPEKDQIRRLVSSFVLESWPSVALCSKEERRAWKEILARSRRWLRLKALHRHTNQLLCFLFVASLRETIRNYQRLCKDYFSPIWAS